MEASVKTSSGVTLCDAGLDHQTWNILDQICVPKHVSEHSFSRHSMLPEGIFAPRHIHPTQDEFLYLLEGNLEFTLGEGEPKAGPGDLVALPLGVFRTASTIGLLRP
jgi:quercetin dioxygenase-like cupin family protein